jgi:hypothetical protein
MRGPNPDRGKRYFSSPNSPNYPNTYSTPGAGGRPEGEDNHSSPSSAEIKNSNPYTSPESSRRLKLQEFLDNRHMKVVRLSALRTGRLYSPGNIPGTHAAEGLCQ